MQNMIRGLRLVHRLTLDDLSQKARIDPGNLSKIERGIVPPSARSRKVLSGIFKVPAEVLFPKV
jgi:transcriptional regulator with XRE-family HTH domain